MSYRVFASAAVCAVALVVGACDKQGDPAASAPKPPETGIVDLDQVATEMGYFREMETNLDVLKKQYETDLLSQQNQYNADVQAELVRLGVKEGEVMTPQQKQALDQFVAMRRQAFNTIQQAAAQRLQAYKADWLRRYREALEPVVRDVAFAKKAKFVVEKSASVLFADSSIDLTAAVTDAARAKPPVFSPPARPPFPTIDLPVAATQPGTAPAATRPATAPATAPATSGKK